MVILLKNIYLCFLFFKCCAFILKNFLIYGCYIWIDYVFGFLLSNSCFLPLIIVIKSILRSDFLSETADSFSIGDYHWIGSVFGFLFWKSWYFYISWLSLDRFCVRISYPKLQILLCLIIVIGSILCSDFLQPETVDSFSFGDYHWDRFCVRILIWNSWLFSSDDYRWNNSVFGFLVWNI